MFAVIGSGHGGQAMAGYLVSQGFSTILYNRTASVLDGIKKNDGIELRGFINAKVKDILLTNNLEEAMANADVVMVCVPANSHKDIALNIAPYVRDNYSIILNPGRTLGAYYFSKHLKQFNCLKNAKIAETDTFILTSRKIEDGCSEIMSLKKVVYVASDTNENTREVCELISKPFPMVKAAGTEVYTSLSNIGSIFHSIPAILNIGRIENKNKYLHYKEGITPSICHLMEKLDYERLTLASSLGAEVPSAKMWLENVYGSIGNGLYDTLQNTCAYSAVFAPTEISTRYIYEDITTGIVPMYCMAKEIGSPHVIMKLVIELASAMFDFDFYRQGRHDVKEFLNRTGKCLYE